MIGHIHIYFYFSCYRDPANILLVFTLTQQSWPIMLKYKDSVSFRNLSHFILTYLQQENQTQVIFTFLILKKFFLICLFVY